MTPIFKRGRGFYQWDSGQYLIIEGADGCKEVHFANQKSKEALVVPIQDTLDGRVVYVPNILLQEANPITAYVFYITSEGGYTRYSQSFHISSRPKPESYVYTETEVLNYESLVERIDQIAENGVSDEQISNAVNSYFDNNPIDPEAIGALPAEKLPEAIAEALAQAKASGEFQGEPGNDGVSAAHEWNGTVLTVTSASGTSSADLKGEKGDPGEKGADGEKGDPGNDGYTPVKGTDYFTAADKTEMVNSVLAALPTWTGGNY